MYFSPTILIMIDHYLPVAAVSRLRNAALFAQEDQTERGEFSHQFPDQSVDVFPCLSFPTVSNLFPTPLPFSLSPLTQTPKTLRG